MYAVPPAKRLEISLTSGNARGISRGPFMDAYDKSLMTTYRGNITKYKDNGDIDGDSLGKDNGFGN